MAPASAGLQPAAAGAQTMDDGFLFPRHQVRVGAEYGRDQWNEYWEGGLQRTNDNIGTLTTRSVVGTLPYVWTEASAGVLRGLSGRQDLTAAAKYRVLRARVAGRATLGAFATAGVGVPTNRYTVGFMPTSIGDGSRRALGRAVLHLQDRTGWYVEGAAGHTWRSNVRLDRPAYYTSGRLYSTNEVEMPDIADYAAAADYVRDAGMSEVRAARTFALLNMAMHDAAVGCWRVKYQYFDPRPAQLDPSIKTVIGLPNFPAYPSGHSTFSAAAGVLGHLFPAAAGTFAAQADEVGISRMYGGIHYRSDIEGGKLHGQRIGAAVVRLARGDGAE